MSFILDNFGRTLQKRKESATIPSLTVEKKNECHNP